MWQRRNAYLWLVGRTIRVLKQTRKWYGPVAFCQGHTEREGQWKKDWLSSPQDIRAKVPLLLDRYGLAGWRIHVVIGGPDKTPFSWPILLVELALSKPDTVVVTKVSGRDKGAVVEGLTATPDGARKWQNYLQSGGRYQAAVTRMQPKGGEDIPFSLEVSCHEETSKP